MRESSWKGVRQNKGALALCSPVDLQRYLSIRRELKYPHVVPLVYITFMVLSSMANPEHYISVEGLPYGRPISDTTVTTALQTYDLHLPRRHIPQPECSYWVM